MWRVLNMEQTVPTDKAIKVRDQLNRIIEDLLIDKEDQESNILACCVALSVEEVEKWAYKGEFTPSVAPIVQGKSLGIPFKNGQDNDEEWTGLAWERVKKTPLSDMAVLNKLKAKTASKPMIIATPSILDRYQPGDWDDAVRKAFFEGDRLIFMRSIREMVAPAPVGITEASEYLNRMRKDHPAMWASRKGITQ